MRRCCVPIAWWPNASASSRDISKIFFMRGVSGSCPEAAPRPPRRCSRPPSRCRLELHAGNAPSVVVARPFSRISPSSRCSSPDIAVPELASLFLREHDDLPSALGEPLEHRSRVTPSPASPGLGWPGRAALISRILYFSACPWAWRPPRSSPFFFPRIARPTGDSFDSFCSSGFALQRSRRCGTPTVVGESATSRGGPSSRR